MIISIKKELSNVLSFKDVLYKKNKFIISDFNYFTFIDILRFVSPENFYRLMELDQEKLKVSVNSIIAENRKMSPVYIIKYICSLSNEQLQEISENYFLILDNFLKNSSFQISGNKALIYLDDNLLIDFEYLFNNFDKVDTLFIFDEKNGTLKVIDRNINVLKKYGSKNKKIKESDIFIIFQDYTKDDLGNDKKAFYNEMLNRMLEAYLNPNTFIADFLDEIGMKIYNLVLMEDRFEIDARNLELMEKNLSRFKNDDKLCDAITKLIGRKNNVKDKYDALQKA